MKAGEFKSVRAAALEAGIVQKRVSVPVDVNGAARALARHFTREQRREIVLAMTELETFESGEATQAAAHD